MSNGIPDRFHHPLLGLWESDTGATSTFHCFVVLKSLYSNILAESFIILSSSWPQTRPALVRFGFFPIVQTGSGLLNCPQ